MDILTEALSLNEDTEFGKSTIQLPHILKKIRSFKEDIHNNIEDVHLKYRNLPKRNKVLLDTTAQLTAEVEDLQKKIENVVMTDINNRSVEVDTLTNELGQFETALRSVRHLVKLQELFIKIKEYQSQHKYIEAGYELIHVSKLINNIPPNETTDITEALRNKITSEKELLVEMIEKLFEENVIMTDDKLGNIQTNSIKIKKDSQEITNLLTILRLFEVATKSLDQFYTFLWESICKPVINNFALVKIEEEKYNHILSIVIKKTTTTKHNYPDVYTKLIKIFEFLHARFNYKIDDLNTISYIGNKLQTDLSKLLITEYLISISENISENSEQYQQLIADTKNFQNKLVELQLFDAGTNPILNYTNNIDLLFINKKCEEYSLKAISFMKNDLHDTVKVGMPYDPQNPLTGDDFPECSVSRSTIDLLEQAEDMFKVALNESNITAAHIICAIQSIFYQYGNIVYGHHEKLLQTIPQQVVLYRNNCMYLAHQLTQFNKVYSKQFPPDVLPEPPIFKDQPHQLRTVGGDIFLGYVEQHITAMEVTLGEYRFLPQQLSENLCADTDKCLRQCLRQYELLKTVWHKILPHAVYNKTLAYLLNTFCKKLIEVVVEAQDISSKNAEHLIEMYKVVIARGPKLFTDSQEISLYVESWNKLNDLVFILGANLIQISERWAHGKGPLTLTFTPDEMRHLIKALFQNTDRRAAILSQI